jgi:hypothetical protein
MGLGNDSRQHYYEANEDGETWPVEVPAYSTDIAAAWEVVDAIRYKHGGGLLELYHNGTDTWAARFDEEARLTTCDTAPHTICLAALKVVGGIKQ